MEQQLAFQGMHDYNMLIPMKCLINNKVNGTLQQSIRLTYSTLFRVDIYPHVTYFPLKRAKNDFTIA
jgi:hypothetical protein